MHSTCAIPRLQGICNVRLMITLDCRGQDRMKGKSLHLQQPGGKIVSLTRAGRQRQKLSMHEKLTMEFNERKLMYLKEEHDMKMHILHVELSMKEEERNMKQQ
ncbi:unnamed protein product [Oncorhynchus mykiss]|uniref:Uncharacterized protein n=1 Tax=Oncorhynchus mykiss TaxID=8022 RepID=A0A060WTR8_ONCMY|nr:unnamed protein product [Oncorhynchus mykiss]